MDKWWFNALNYNFHQFSSKSFFNVEIALLPKIFFGNIIRVPRQKLPMYRYTAMCFNLPVMSADSITYRYVILTTDSVTSHVNTYEVSRERPRGAHDGKIVVPQSIAPLRSNFGELQ